MQPPLAHVVLVRPEIPWNTGNAGRTCLAAGAQLHLVGPLGFSMRDRDVQRAGLDYWPRVRPRLWGNWEEFEACIPELGEPFLFTTAGRSDLWSVDLPARSVLIFGPEGAGLPRALLQAGARRFLASLWRVEDRASGEFMRRFYRHLAVDERPAEALRNSQVEMIGHPEFSSPANWAAWVLWENESD